MNAAEEIVKFWYENKGYFVMDSLRIPNGRNKEVDLLAIKLDTDKTGIADRIHIEVSVSNHCMFFSKEKINKVVKTEAQTYHDKKFVDKKIKGFVTQLLGNNYRMVEVRGKIILNNKTDLRPAYIKERAKMDVEVIPFETILAEVIKSMSANTQANPVIQTVQLAKYQI